MDLDLLKEYLKMGEMAMSERCFNAAVVLHHRAFDFVIDQYLIAQRGHSCDSHYDKLQALKATNPSLAELSYDLYPVYRRSYDRSIDEATARDFQKKLYDLINQSTAVLGKDDVFPHKSIFPGGQKTLEMGI